MQSTYSARYRAKNLEEIRKKDRESKKLKRQKQKEISALHPWPMGDFSGNAASHLYIFRYEFDPCGTMGLKIGRSENVSMQKAQMEQDHNFEMKVLRVYTGCGHLETIVHKLLSTKRSTTGSSREWFDCQFDTAMLAVRLAKDLYESDNCAFSYSESSSEQEGNQSPCKTLSQ